MSWGIGEDKLLDSLFGEENPLIFIMQSSAQQTLSSSSSSVSGTPPYADSIYEEIGEEIGVREVPPQQPSTSGLFHSIVRSVATSATPGLEPAIADAHRSINETRAFIQEDCRPAIGAVHAAANGAVEATQSLMSLLDHLKQLLTAVPTLSSFMKTIMDSICLLYEMMVAWIQKVYLSLPALIYRFFSLFGLPEKLIYQIVSRLTVLLTPIESNQGREIQEAQSVWDMNLFGTLSEIVGMTFLKRNPSKGELSAVNEVLRFRGMWRNEAKNLKEGLLEFVQALPEVCKAWAERVLPSRWWYGLFAPGSEYYTWMCEVEEFEGHDIRDRACYDFDLQTRIRNAYDLGKQLIKDCAKAPAYSKVFNLLSVKMKKLEDLFLLVDAAGATRSNRPEPFCAYFAGEPGKGKTFLMAILPAILAGAPAHTPNLSYTRNPGMDFWDGYTGQFATCYDDFNAIRGNAPTSEFEEFLAIISNQPKQLNMAKLEEKGAAFRSRVVLMTSNRAFPVGNEVNTPNAIWRRRHAMYNIDVAPQFQKPSGEVDPTLIPDDNSHYVIRKHLNPTSNIVGWGPPMTYNEFLADIVAHYHRHRDQQLRSMDRTAGMVAAAIEEHNENFQDAQGLADELAKVVERKRCVDVAMRTFSTIMGGVVLKYGFQWQRDLAKALDGEDPSDTAQWVSAALTVIGIVSGVCAISWIWTKITSSIEASLDVDKAEKVANLYLEAQGINEITPAQMEMVEKIVRMTWADKLSENEIQSVLKKTFNRYQLAQGAYSGPKAHKVMRPAIIRAPVQEPQAHTDENAMAVAEKMMQSMAVIHLGNQTMQGIFLAGRTLLTVGHLFKTTGGEDVEDGNEMQITVQNVVFRDCFERKNLRLFGDDLAIYECGPNVRVFKDIRKHFITDRDLNNKAKIDAWLYTQRNNVPTIVTATVSRLDIPVHVVHPANVGRRKEFFFANPKQGWTVNEANGWRYRAPTTRGDCGAVLLANEPSYARKALGIHIAGAPDLGECTAHILTQEMIKEVMSLLPQPIIAADPRGDIQEVESGLFMSSQGNFTHFGKLAKKIFISSKTKILPSTIHRKIFEPVTEPAVLTPTDPRLKVDVSPLLQGVEKYGNVATVLDPNLVAEIGMHLSNLFENWKETMPREVVTEAIAINGHPHYDYAEAIPMDTSAGYPYNQVSKIEKGKRDLFSGEPGEYAIRDKTLMVNVRNRWNYALEGKRYPSLWIDNLKDERRPLAKIELGKTRVFVVPPADYTIVFRRLHFAFLVNFYENALTFFSAVGIDPESKDWTHLYKRLREYGDEGFAGDYSSWDGNISPQMIMEVANIINRWYDDEDRFQLARLVMFDEVVHTPQVAGSSVYSTHLGVPSGFPATAPVNTIIGAMYIRYAWLKRAPPLYRSLSHYEDNVRDAIYGDDVLAVVRDEVKPFFNPETIEIELNSMGMKFTAATKDKKAEFEPLLNLTFLKRGFYKGQRGRLLPIMAKETIQELTNWVRKSDFVTPEEMTIDNCNESLRFAFFRGKPFFEELRAKIIRALITGKERIKDWTYYYQWFYQEENGHMFQEAQSNVVRNEVNAKGVISLSQREAKEDTGSEGPIAPNKILSSMAISDPEWTLPEMSKRRVWVDTFSWSTSDVFQHSYKAMNAPKEFLVNYLQTAPFERFLFWNGSMTIRIHVNGTRFHAGRLIAYFVPWTEKAMAQQWHGTHMAAAWSVPNVQLDASSNNVGVLTIPFYNIRSAMFLGGPSQDEIDFTGSFHLTVLSPLTAASGTAPSINVTLWVEFNEDQEFRIPQHSAASSRRVLNEEHRNEMRKFQEAQGNTITTNNDIKNYGQIEGGAVPMNVTGDSIGNGTSVSLPMDKPARPWNPQPFYRKAFQNLASTYGSELTTRLDLHTANLNLSIGEMFGTQVDEMALDHIFTRPTYMTSVPWTSAQTTGTSLMARWIGPGASLFQDASPNQITLVDSGKVLLTAWETAVLPFMFWRGGIKLRFDIVATQMHTGRLFLSLNYGAPPDAEVGLRDATSQYGVEIDLSNECRTFEFTIPYNAPTPWLRVCRGPIDSVTQYANTWFVKNFTGSWSLRVLNELVAPDNVAANVDIIVSMAGADDFEVYYPSATNETFILPASAYAPVTGVLRGFQEAQGDEAGTDAVSVPTAVESMETPGISIAPEGVRLAPAHSHFGPKASIKHIGELIKRYNPLEQVNLTTIANGNRVLYKIPNILAAPPDYNDLSGFVRLSPTQGGTAPTGSASYVMYVACPVAPILPSNPYAGTYSSPSGPRGLATYFGSWFRFWRGGMRFKVIWDGVKDFNGTPINFATAGVTYIPAPVTIEKTRGNWPAAAVHFSQTMVQTSMSDYLIAPTQRFQFNRNTSSLAIDVNTDGARYNDIEVPFTSIYNVLPTNNYLTTAYGNYEDLNAGYVLFMAVFHYPGDTTSMTNLEANGLAGYPVIYRAMGDDFRFGTYLGPPILSVLSTYRIEDTAASTYTYYCGPSDTWTISAPSFEVKKKDDKRTERANSDMTESIIAEAVRDYKAKKGAKFQEAQSLVDLHDANTEFLNSVKRSVVPSSFDLTREQLATIRIQVAEKERAVVGDWQVIDSRASVLAQGGACFHLPYNVLKKIMALFAVWRNLDLPTTAKQTILLGEQFFEFLLDDDFSNPQKFNELIRTMEKKFNIEPYYAIRRIDGRLQAMGIVYGLGSTMMVGNILLEWVNIPVSQENLAFDFAKSLVFSHLYRMIVSFLYLIAQGQSYGAVGAQTETSCIDCIQYVQDSLKKFCGTTKLLGEYAAETAREPEARSFQHAQGFSDDEDCMNDYLDDESLSKVERRERYRKYIIASYDPDERNMREGCVARSLLNEVCMRFPDKYQEHYFFLGEEWYANVRYSSWTMQDPIRMEEKGKNKKAAQEKACLSILRKLVPILLDEELDYPSADQMEAIGRTDGFSRRKADIEPKTASTTTAAQNPTLSDVEYQPSPSLNDMRALYKDVMNKIQEARGPMGSEEQAWIRLRMKQDNIYISDTIYADFPAHSGVETGWAIIFQATWHGRESKRPCYPIPGRCDKFKINGRATGAKFDALFVSFLTAFFDQSFEFLQKFRPEQRNRFVAQLRGE